MDDTRTETPGKPTDRDDVSLTRSQTGHDTDGRSPDYDIETETGLEEKDDAAIRETRR